MLPCGASDNEEAPLRGGGASVVPESGVQTNPPGDKSLLQRVFVIARPGWRKLARSTWGLPELSGALGDIGTFLPLTVNLAARPECGIDFGAALLMSGVHNLCSVL